ncbi:DUF983 domain-containing protein [Bradyrhizobium ontarionense]|uniref:DUF983 domain-containing protein n=1 Tax=Bradyrhizobium ontarionense TaxID=2898149 RepID=A0ABY3R6A8_9BRAD|nr:DUF983 domain-containing protein [Bradyrhizobium sp. A19]UFZ02728.1 DUF983 domain-containing protein [Bradyrhizobium sp. A19]
MTPVKHAHLPERQRPLYPGNSFNPPRPVLSALLHGLCCRCPCCGCGRLFNGFLAIAPSCASCGEDLHHARPDDAPAYFVILIVGHIAVFLALAMEQELAPPLWATMTAAIIVTCLLTAVLLQPTKGAIIALQWALWMHGFDPTQPHDDPTHCPADLVADDGVAERPSPVGAMPHLPA